MKVIYSSMAVLVCLCVTANAFNLGQKPYYRRVLGSFGRGRRPMVPYRRLPPQVKLEPAAEIARVRAAPGPKPEAEVRPLSPQPELTVVNPAPEPFQPAPENVQGQPEVIFGQNRKNPTNRRRIPNPYYPSPEPFQPAPENVQGQPEVIFGQNRKNPTNRRQIQNPYYPTPEPFQPTPGVIYQQIRNNRNLKTNTRQNPLPEYPAPEPIQPAPEVEPSQRQIYVEPERNTRTYQTNRRPKPTPFLQAPELYQTGYAGEPYQPGYAASRGQSQIIYELDRNAVNPQAYARSGSLPYYPASESYQSGYPTGQGQPQVIILQDRNSPGYGQQNNGYRTISPNGRNPNVIIIHEDKPVPRGADNRQASSQQGAFNQFPQGILDAFINQAPAQQTTLNNQWSATVQDQASPMTQAALDAKYAALASALPEPPAPEASEASQASQASLASPPNALRPSKPGYGPNHFLDTYMRHHMIVELDMPPHIAEAMTNGRRNNNPLGMQFPSSPSFSTGSNAGPSSAPSSALVDQLYREVLDLPPQPAGHTATKAV